MRRTELDARAHGLLGRDAVTALRASALREVMAPCVAALIVGDADRGPLEPRSIAR